MSGEAAKRRRRSPAKVGGSGSPVMSKFRECECVNEVFTDIDGNKFYTGVILGGVTVQLGSFVQVLLENDDHEDDDEAYAYCQILAIYDDMAKGEGVHVEVRWFLEPFEVHDIRKKVNIEILDNELFESDGLDDIPAGSIKQLIIIKDYKRDSDKLDRVSDSSYFICRYMESSATNSLQKVSLNHILDRGIDLSAYRHAYVSHLETCNDIHSTSSDRYSVALRQLHISVIPDSLPCRTEHKEQIENYIKKQINASINNDRNIDPPMYISGMPGTGKTATVLASIMTLKKSVKLETSKCIASASTSSNLKNDFNFIEINCLRLQSPGDIYTALWRGMTGYHLNAKAALKQIKQYIDAGVNIKKPEELAKREYHVVLVDEIDFLLTKDEAAIYHFFDWPLHANSRLILISISNTFDLANRLSQRVQSRVSSVMRLLFAPYTYTEIGVILTKRLDDLSVYFPQAIFDKDSINLLSRKAANVAGDLRAALKICQKAIEMLRDEGKGSENNQSTHPKVTSSIISRAAEEYKENPMIVMLQNSCKLDRALILSLCKHFNVTGSMECEESELWDRLCDLIFSVKGNPLMKPPLIQPPYYIFLTCIQRLAAMGYIQVATAKANAHGSSQYKVQLITLKMDASEIKATLMGSGDPLVEYGGFSN